MQRRLQTPTNSKCSWLYCALNGQKNTEKQKFSSLRIESAGADILPINA